MTSIVWFRQDLRLADQPALTAAAQQGEPIIPVYIWETSEKKSGVPGAASRWWLHQSLQQLQKSLAAKGGRLIVRKGQALLVLIELARECHAKQIYWNRCYEPQIRKRDASVLRGLKKDGLRVETFKAQLLHEPDEVKNKAGQPFKVFTPFYRYYLSLEEPSRALPVPRKLRWPRKWPHSMNIRQLQLEPKVDWAIGLRNSWKPGEAGAKRRLDRFVENKIALYSDHRDRPDLEGTSRLSPHLHFGEISPRSLWQSVIAATRIQRKRVVSGGAEEFLRQVVWREFASHLLHHFPDTTSQPLRKEFAHFGWSKSKTNLLAWQKGQTGYPIVDAGMRELWHTGWMHNRVRLIVASFLVKDLLIHWREGERWFWDTLVDADLANNILGWQWTAGCGADAAPFFRVFNPVTQGRKFDPNGDYVRHWIPELSRLPTQWIHAPWMASRETMSSLKIKLGTDYPHPIVQHDAARKRALAAFKKLRKNAA